MNSKEMAFFAARNLDTKKAEDVQIIDIANKSGFADYFVMASAGSERQLKALVDEIEFLFEKEQVFVKRIEGSLEKELSSNLKLNIIDSYVFDNDIYVESLFINYEFYGYILISSEIITKKDKEAIYIVKKYFDNFYQNQ